MSAILPAPTPDPLPDAGRDMGRRPRFGIQQKLFCIVLSALVLNIFLLLMLGSTMFERLYMENKIQQLKTSADEIRKAYGVSEEAYTAAFEEAENRNILVRVFHRDEENEVVVDYYTRFGFSPERKDKNPGGGQQRDDRFIRDFLGEFFESGLDQRLQTERFVVRDTGRDGWPSNNIVLYTGLEDGLYLSLDTPRQFIAESAELAIKSCATISLFTLIFAAVAVYFICRGITRPIKKIQRAADGIAAMDFSARCPVSSRDELGMLGAAVNHMSDRLQEYIRDLFLANQRLRDDLHRQEQQDQMRKRFIANVSHDFKTPLTLITSYADSLRELDDSQAGLRQEYCGIIASEGYKMTRMVQMLLNLSRLESGMVHLSMMPFSVSEVLEDAVRRQSLLAERRGLTVEYVLPDEIIVEADYQRVEQAFTNLLENAVKYAPEQGLIRVAAERRESRCVVRVFNTGDPIAPADLQKLFISFYRTDESRGCQEQSYGLGLAIVRSILELHQQEYGCRNLADGVEFWFTLAIADIDADEDPEDGALPEQE